MTEPTVPVEAEAVAEQPQPPGMPMWMKAVIALAVLAVLGVIAVMALGGAGSHGPGRHGGLSGVPGPVSGPGGSPA